MMKHVLCLAKDGEKYVFRYRPGDEGRIVDEIMYQADRQGGSLDWMDAATLSFQVAQNAAIDCCASLTPNAEAEPVGLDPVNRAADGDDAKDGPCANCP